MPIISKTVTIFGGGGFVGRYVAQRMARQGWRVRVALRRPNEALFVKTYGVVGQVEPIFANICDDKSVDLAISGVNAVVNCVGILNENEYNFNTIHNEGAGRIARIAQQHGVNHLVHISAIGASKSADSVYSYTKAEGESYVRSAFNSAVILRPSIIFGCEDNFFNRFAVMAKFFPILPVVGAHVLFQPVYVDDVAAAVEHAIINDIVGDIYELGGPDIESFEALLRRLLWIIRRQRFIMPVNFRVARLLGRFFDFLQLCSLGIWNNKILTQDQVKSLQVDNIVAKGAKSFKELGIDPTSMDTILPHYLYYHRPHGQYSILKESARDLSQLISIYK